MISRSWVVAVATVAGALALVWLARPGSDNVTPEPVTAATVAPPGRIVADTNVSRPVEPALAPRATASAGDRANVEPRAEHGLLPAETAAPEGERGVIPNQAERDRRFQAEPVDREWAPGAEAELLRKLAEIPGLKVTTMRVECRSTMCRLDLTLPAGAASINALPPNPTLGLRPTLVIATRDPSGAPSTLMYFTRPGHEPSALRRDTAAR